MGMDMRLDIVQNKNYIASDIFPGRNSEWFNNMMQRGNNSLYDFLPVHGGNSPQVPDSWANYYGSEDNRDCYFGNNYITVKDYMKWFEKYKPHIDAGWVTTYEKWEYETRGVEPEVYHFLPDNANINDMVFIEVENKYDCSRWLYDYLLEHKIPLDADLQYCFDN